MQNWQPPLENDYVKHVVTSSMSGEGQEEDERAGRSTTWQADIRRETQPG